MPGRRNAAVVAGLGGAVLAAVPAPAYALSVQEVSSVVFQSPQTAFATGLVGGAVLASVCVGALALAGRGRAGAAADDADFYANEPQADALADAPAHVVFDDDAPAAAPQAFGEKTYRPRHMAPAAPDSAPAARKQAPAKATASNEPQVEYGVGGSNTGRAHAGHAARDYEEIAQNYVGKATFRARMATRAAGVAETLRERMAQSRMEGVPVLERADGTVGDVGTGWWSVAVGEASISRDLTPVTGAAEAIPSSFDATDRDLLQAAAKTARPAAAHGRPNQRISDRIAFVDEGMFPERRSMEDLSSDDAWASALKSLDEKIEAEAPEPAPAAVAFADPVGAADTLDEPDNIEPNTAFIPFKTPAGHPEVVDTESYIDYLIGDEFNKNASNAARRSSRRFLRVLEGGTQATQATTSRHLAGTTGMRRTYEAKHFSMPKAVEA